MDINALRRRIEKVTPFIAQHFASDVPPALASGFDMEMYDEDERERLLMLFEQIEPKLTWFHGTRQWIPGLSKLSVEERDRFESWITLQRAMNEDDAALAARTRRYLTLSPEDKEWIRSVFLALDERTLPDMSAWEAVHSGLTLQWGRGTVHLTRGALRFARDHAKQEIAHGNYIRRYEIDNYWMWLEVCQEHTLSLVS